MVDKINIIKFNEKLNISYIGCQLIIFSISCSDRLIYHYSKFTNNWPMITSNSIYIAILDALTDVI